MTERGDREGSGRVVTVFRSRLRDDHRSEYAEWADRMLDIARAMPGFVDFKVFQAEDGERVSVITFDSLDHQRAWRDHPEHRAAQRLGRERFYRSYGIQVGEIIEERDFQG